MTGPETARLLGPAEIRQLASRLGLRPTKKLGQNFVIDHGTVRRIRVKGPAGPPRTPGRLRVR